MKDQSTFLAAAGQLKGMAGSVRFVLVGLNQATSNRSLVTEIEQYGLRDRIVLLGIRQDVPRIMAGLDCLVSTSTSEGFPNVIGEAMACGVPCVATDAGDSRLIVGDTGTILPIGDVAGVVAGVWQLMDASAEERQARSARCRRRIVEHYELTDIASRYAEFYRELHERRLLHRAAPRAIPAPAVRQVSASGGDHGVAVGEAWQERFTELAVKIEQKRQAKAGGDTAPEPRVASPRGLLPAFTAAAVLYVVVFHTPLVWFAGNQLTIREAPHRADAIVVFSGNGESTYINSGYQRRARDAARYYKAGFAPMLVISSGIEQTFSEVEIIRALLLSQGIPPEAMYIVPKYPRSTRENVDLVNVVLKERKATSILFITAPYHSRRASLIWRKVAPEVRVTTVPVVDTPPANPQWYADLAQIKAIAYEYLAIAYNLSKGWL
jgi:uncharacterized SAM-binding protein YcdF (DUF218 family)